MVINHPSLLYPIASKTVVGGSRIVLMKIDNRHTPYCVTRVYKDGNCAHGGYFKTIDEALPSFHERAGTQDLRS